ncbi:MAG: hypothetical protein ACK413_02145 [Patescibacteria group bacterium]
MEREKIDFTEKGLKIAYFFITKKAILKKILIILLIIIDILIFIYLIHHFTQYFSQSKEWNKMMEEMTKPYFNHSEIHQIISPLPLQIISTKAINVGYLKYNLICQVINPNENWLAKSLNYKFTSSNFTTPSFSTFILPQEERLLVVFNQTVSGRRDFSCEITNLSWQKIKPFQYYLLEIPKGFLIKDLKHIPGKKEDERDITIFKFINTTVYNFWEVDLIIVAYYGNEIVGIDKFPIKEIMSGEEREIKIVWSNPLPFISEIKVYPIINVFDPTLFITPKVQPRE